MQTSTTIWLRVFLSSFNNQRLCLKLRRTILVRTNNAGVGVGVGVASTSKVSLFFALIKFQLRRNKSDSPEVGEIKSLQKLKFSKL